MGRSAQPCEVMVMVVMVMLVCGWTDGQVVSKCDLRSRLQKAFLRHPSDVIAKMVCTVEYISVFNTSLVTTNNNGPPGSLIGPQGDNYPIPEVIGDYFPENWPGTAEPENPSFPPEVVSDDLIPARPSQKPAVTSVQSGEEQGSGDEPPSGNGSGKGSKSQSGGKHGVNSGEESGKDSSGESSKSKSKGKREVDSGEGSGEDSSGYHFSGEGSGSSGEPLEATTAIPLLDSTNEDIPFDSYESLYGHEQREGSGEPLEPTTAIPEGDSTNNDFFPGGSDEIPDWQRQYPDEPYFQHRLHNPIPPFGSNNEDIHYDTYEMIYGHKQREASSTAMPMTTDNGNLQDSSPRNLYGIFQLSDDMACQTQGRHSLNVCSLYCEDLIDSDITDDIDCLMTLKHLGMDVMVLEQCQTIGASEYFAECD